MKIFIALLNYVMMAAFFLSALVQYNDPDPLLWMLMYGLAAGACLLFATGRLHFWISVGLGVLALGWSLALLPGVLGSGESLSAEAVFGTTEMINERVELVREIGGLLLVAGWMLVLGLARRAARQG